MAKLGLLSVAALCLAVCMLPGILSQKLRKGGNAIEKGSDNVDDDVWLFHFGPADNRVEYLDPLTGQVRGHYVDLLESVCEIADRNCQIVYDLQSNCWDNVDGVPVGGFGLFNFYYDACMGWLPTSPRLRTFKFTDSFRQNPVTGLSVLAGNLDSFDPTDLTDKKIGFIRGFFTDPVCVAMQGDAVTGSDLSDDQIMYFPSAVQAQEALLDGDIDAMFTTRNTVANQEEFEFLNDDSPLYCAFSGGAMMTRKDNNLKTWFDPALQELLASDKYQEICERIEEEHGDRPGANRDEICVE